VAARIPAMQARPGCNTPAAAARTTERLNLAPFRARHYAVCEVRAITHASVGALQRAPRRRRRRTYSPAGLCGIFVQQSNDRCTNDVLYTSFRIIISRFI